MTTPKTATDEVLKKYEASAGITKEALYDSFSKIPESYYPDIEGKWREEFAKRIAEKTDKLFKEEPKEKPKEKPMSESSFWSELRKKAEQLVNGELDAEQVKDIGVWLLGYIAAREDEHKEPHCDPHEVAPLLGTKRVPGGAKTTGLFAAEPKPFPLREPITPYGPGVSYTTESRTEVDKLVSEGMYTTEKSAEARADIVEKGKIDVDVLRELAKPKGDET